MDNQHDSFDNRLQKAFDFCAETSKQLINIAVGIIAFTITFSKDFIGDVDSSYRWIAILAWCLFLFSALLGILTLSALASQLESGGTEQKKPSIWSTPVTISTIGQWFFFMVGLSLTIIFGYLALNSQNNKKPDNKSDVSLPNSTVTVKLQDTSQKKVITDIPKISRPLSVSAKHNDK